MAQHYPLSDLQTAVYELIKKFVERQRLPYDVIKQYRPRWLGSSQERLTKEYLSATGHGRWGENNEWSYFLHGVGCQLIHSVTGEVINWDASDLNRFDKYWFLGWLQSIKKQGVVDDSLALVTTQIDLTDDDLKNPIFTVIDQLCEVGKLRHCEYNKYILIVPDSQ